MKFNLFKKSISPIISVVLLILISVAMIYGILNYSKTKTTDTLDDARSESSKLSRLKCIDTFLTVDSCSIDPVSKNIELILNNYPSKTKISGLKLNISGIDSNGNKVSAYGRFNESLDISDRKRLNTSLNSFEFLKKTNNFDLLDISTADIILTNSTCPDTTININDCLIKTFDNNLVLYTPLDSETVSLDKGEVNDLSKNKLIGNINSSPTLTTGPFGDENTALSFDGVDDYINLGDFNFYNKQITVSYWLKTKATKTSGSTIFSKQAGFSEDTYLNNRFYSGSNNLGIQMSDGSTYPSFEISSTDFNLDFNNIWTNFVWVYDSFSEDKIKIYVDGELYKQGASGFFEEIILAGDPFVIGGSKSGSSITQTLDGNLSNFRFYDKALSENEIKSIYFYEEQLKYENKKNILKDLGTYEKPARSCKEIYTFHPYKKDGNYWIDPNGAPYDDKFKIYCDMKNGGWTLLLKIKGNDYVFKYSSSLWDTLNLLNEDSLNLDNVNAKFNSYNNLEITEIKAVFPEINHIMYEKIDLQTSLELFTTPNSIYFEDLVDGCSTNYEYGDFDKDNFLSQDGYQRYGFNLDSSFGCSKTVRWGWIWNNETHCSSVDVMTGIGISERFNMNSGSWTSCCDCQGMPDGAYPLRVLVWGR